MPNIPCERVAHPSAGMSDRSAVENAGTARLRRRYCPCRAAFKPAETVTSEIRHQCLSMNGGGKRAGVAAPEGAGPLSPGSEIGGEIGADGDPAGGCATVGIKIEWYVDVGPGDA